MRSLRLAVASTVTPDGAVPLPGPVLWALALNEGDLVATDRPEEGILRLRFRSYGRRVRGAVESCGHPWGFVEEFLRLPLVAIGPAGTLDLSSLGRPTPFRPGEPLLLRAGAGHEEHWFTLNRWEGQPALELEAEAHYRLEMESGFQVTLPEDALWALSLSEGSTVVCKTSMNTLVGWTSTEGELLSPLRLEIGPGGALPLPEALRGYARLQPGSNVRFEVNLSGQSTSFRLEPDLA